MLGATAVLAGAQIIASIGNPSTQSLVQAQSILSSMPDDLKKMLATIDDAQALMFAMLLALEDKPDYSKIELADPIKQKIRQCLGFKELTDHTYRATLVDLAIPTLKKMDPAAVDTFLNSMYKLVDEHKTITIFKAVLLTILTQRLRADAFKNVKPKFSNFKAVSSELSCILWFMAKEGAIDIAEQRKAYITAIKTLDPSFNLQIDDQKFLINDLINSLTRLRLVLPTLKEQFLQACVICIKHDNTLETGEAELLRAVCSCMDCPVPLL